MTQDKSSNPARAASAYKLALDLQVMSERVAAEFPALATKLREVSRAAVGEARKAEGQM